MSFLQPWMLFALPLAAIPIIIHLVNQRRYQTMPWGAMRFLLTANRMTRGYARVRQWLILAMRTIAIAALIFAIGRPLASGTLGGGLIGSIAGGGVDQTIVLIDRSPSMQRIDNPGGSSNLQAGVEQVTQTLDALGTGRVTLIDNVSPMPRELASPSELLSVPQIGPSDASSDIASMLIAAGETMAGVPSGQTEVWIVSDLRENDWRPSDVRWGSIRDSFASVADRVRFRLIDFSNDAASANLGVRVSDVRLRRGDDKSMVTMTIDLNGTTRAKQTPVTVDLMGSPTTVEVSVDGGQGRLKDYPIDVPSGTQRGWGRVSIPADSLAADNEFYFTFEPPPPRRTVIVSDDAEVGRVLRLAAEISPTADRPSVAEVVGRDAFANLDLTDVSLLMWHGPTDDASLQGIRSMVDRGGVVIFWAERASGGEFWPSMKWSDWTTSDEPIEPSDWRGDSDLLAATLAGESLPVGRLKINRYAGLVGDATPLATIGDGQPLVARIASPRGGVYAIATTPRPSDSSLAADGVVLYVMTQRAIELGCESLQAAGQVAAGQTDPSVAADWTRVAGSADRLSTERASTAGVYSLDETLWAVNRSVDEDSKSIVDEQRLATMFGDLKLDRVNRTTGGGSLVEEVWRGFLLALLLSLMIEAALCLPRRQTVVQSDAADWKTVRKEAA